LLETSKNLIQIARVDEFLYQRRTKGCVIQTFNDLLCRILHDVSSGGFAALGALKFWQLRSYRFMNPPDQLLNVPADRLVPVTEVHRLRT
jgi:hypothetical protein